jgi:hypothetical protein
MNADPLATSQLSHPELELQRRALIHDLDGMESEDPDRPGYMQRLADVLDEMSARDRGFPLPELQQDRPPHH